MLATILSTVKHSPTYNAETIEILRLIRSENVGTRTFYSLLQLYGDAKTALENIVELSLKGGRQKPISIFSKTAAEKEIEQLAKIGARLITYKDNDYPYLLKHIPDAPPVITVLGNPKLLSRESVAVVGARNSSGNGTLFAERIAKALGEQGYNVVSGLARGIDTAAHKAALATGTIAVIAGGIEHIYPPENEDLYRKIAEEGAIIAELPIGSVPRAQHFPQRNRIISGISLATIVVEANLKSGSLITARLANEQNREVFAVPGFPLDPRAQGTNRLIKQGAQLIESIDDLLESLPKENVQLRFEDISNNNFTPIRSLIIDEKTLSVARMKVSQLLSSCPIEIDMLLNQSKLELPVLYTILLELELAGKLERHSGNKVSLKYDIK
ncbi:MAG: protecting protein DprA [Rickettsiaceae bacterium]|jgi:DNA processing protein|nr:protecting protein DprA [Rickettsiaceae bacterium]